MTHSGAPDFVASAGGGADWLPLAVIARLDGQWQLVRFDSPTLLGTHLVVQSQAPVRYGMVHSTVDACGCASGPMTSIWYRFDGRRFVPAQPPGRAPACIASTLNLARVLPGYPGYLGGPKARFAPFRASQFACRDGWALAKSRTNRFALFNQQAARWHRATTGSLPGIREIAQYFALPPDLLALLQVRLRR